MKASAVDRVPSWPNRAILCFLFTPALSLILALFLFHRDEDMGPPGGSHQFLWMGISSAGCLAATLPLAARLAYAPHIATAFSVLVWMLVTAFRSTPGDPLSWITIGGIALAWIGRSSFTRPWDPAKLPGWTLRGYRRLLAPDRWAMLRLIGGIALFLGGIAFMVTTGNVLRQEFTVSRPVAKFLAIPAFLGAFLAASGMSLSEPSDAA